MGWFWIALAATLLFAITNFIDKYLITKYFKGGNVGSILIFSGFTGFLIAPVLLIIKYNEVISSVNQSWMLMMSGIIYIVSLLPYLWALEIDDASSVIPLLQLIPVFAFILGIIFLKEFLSTNQLVGGIVIFVGSVILSLELGSKKISFKKGILIFMILTSLGIAIYSLLFKMGSIGINYWTASFWFYLGFGIGGVIFLFYKPYRNQFKNIFKSNAKTVIGLNFANESLNLGGVILINLAFILGPLALVWIVVGLQPLFVFLIGIILTLIVPKLIKEKISLRDMTHKIIGILIILAGTVIINL